MIAMNVRSVPLLTNQILTEKLGQSIEGVVDARDSGRFCHTVGGRIAEGDVAHRLGCLRVNLVSSVKPVTKPKSLTELSTGSITLLRPSHSSHVAFIIKVDSVVELENDIRIVVIFQGCYLRNTKLLQAFINEVKVILNVIVEVRHVECVLMHNLAPLEVCLLIVMVIPHLLLTLSPKQLVSSSVGSLLEMVWITETKLPPQLSMHVSKVAFQNHFRLIGLWRSLLVAS
jgi:hypothetical protein